MKNIPVIYYHSVAPKKNSKWYKSYLTLEQKYFEDLVLWLKKKEFTFIFLDEYFKLRNKITNEKYICLNFDDGCLDNYVHVFPLLKKYAIKATIYVNPEFIPDIDEPRKTIDQFDKNASDVMELEDLGFCSWSELKLMEDSGLVDIQSHTLSHTKYFASTKIREFHHPKANYLYPIANIYPARKPNYIMDTNFIKLLPYGTPFFQEKSALVTKRVFISKRFEEECVIKLKDYNWENYLTSECLRVIQPIYDKYVLSDQLVEKIETDSEYEGRVKHELSESKRIIEYKLNKKVKYCCWPHGDYNAFTHEVAIKSGYDATTIVLKHFEKNIFSDRFDRIGHGSVNNSRFLTLLKMKFKIYAYRGQFPYKQIENIFFRLKYGKS
ncbi:MAG: polysaccharide deacetylase family protein [Bacteroidota bacterium]|jgi:hypothetical protein